MSGSAISKNSFKAWLLAARPKTLTGAATPVLIGLGLSFHDAGQLQCTAAALCLLFAFAMQIDANFINDYYDYAKGTDREDRLGPERACAQGWVSIRAMKRAIALTTLAAAATGLPLIYFGGWQMILIGAVCIVFAFLYTIWLSYKGLGDILVLVFFGVVPVCITYYIQLHAFTCNAAIASLACGLVIDTLLMVNNYRDREQDAVSGKKTIVVRWGAAAGRTIYLGLGIAGYLLCIYLSFSYFWAAILPIPYLVLHILTWREMVQINKGKELNLILGKTARNIFLFGVLLTISFLL